MTRKITAIYGNIVDSLAYLAGVLVIFIMLTIGAEVMVRKLLGFSIAWAVEYSEHAILFITFLSAAWLLKRNVHVKIDVLVDRLNPRGQAWLNMATSLIGAALCLFVAYHSALTAWDVWQRHIYTITIQEVPMAPLMTMIGVGSLLLSIEFMRAAYSYLKSHKVAAGKIEGGRGSL